MLRAAGVSDPRGDQLVTGRSLKVGPGPRYIGQPWGVGSQGGLPGFAYRLRRGEAAHVQSRSRMFRSAVIHRPPRGRHPLINAMTFAMDGLCALSVFAVQQIVRS